MAYDVGAEGSSLGDDGGLHPSAPIHHHRHPFMDQPLVTGEIAPSYAIRQGWQPCVKLPITVHVREQRPGETHSSTREGITPLRPDDLIMRGVQGEEYPIGRELFNQTYRMGVALAQPEGEGPSDQELASFLVDRHRERMESESAFSCPDFDGAKARAARIADARAVLARWGRPAPAPKPIPVIERPWERDGWRDTEGRCWFCNAYSMGRWNYQLPPDSEQDWGILGTETHCLPHWAIARPRPEAKD
jgi:hypothetical protein